MSSNHNLTASTFDRYVLGKLFFTCMLCGRLRGGFPISVVFFASLVNCIHLHGCETPGVGMNGDCVLNLYRMFVALSLMALLGSTMVHAGILVNL